MDLTQLLIAGGTLASLTTPVLAIALSAQSRWTRGVASRNAEQAVTIAGLQRRLEDVSAIRRAPPAHLAIIMDAAKTFRSYQRHHEGEAERLHDEAQQYDDPEQRPAHMAALTDARNRAQKAERNREMAERLEAVLIQTQGGTVGVNDGSGRPVRTRPTTWRGRPLDELARTSPPPVGGTRPDRNPR